MDVREIRKRTIAAYKLFEGDTISRKKFDAIRKLIKGINSDLDDALEKCSKALKNLELVSKKKVIPLSMKAIPEKTEKQKKRKKVLLLFLRRWKKLKRTVKKLSGAYEKGESGETDSVGEQAQGLGKQLFFAKGKFAALMAVTVAAIGGVFYFTSQKTPEVTDTSMTQKSTEEKKMVKVSPPVLVVGSEGEEATSNGEVFDDSAPSYVVEEGSYEEVEGKAMWGIHVHRESDETRAAGTHIPAGGAVVSAELRSDSGVVPLTGVVSEFDAWVRWTQSIPQDTTGLYITDIQGELPWARFDQERWRGKALATSE
jgi:hypothetical protein